MVSSRGRQKSNYDISFTDAYGYRGSDPRIYYLNAWEWTKLWTRESLSAPNCYEENPRTQWTTAGTSYHASMLLDPSLPPPKPRIHYVVIEPGPTEAYITYPDDDATQDLRHRWIMVRCFRPRVPQPTNTPFLKKTMDANEKARILSVYLRPWVLQRTRASAHVPHIADLDIVITDALVPKRPVRRLRGKQATEPQQLPRNYHTAWTDYRSQHVVSHHAARLIQNFLLTQMPESAEADVEDEFTNTKAPWVEVDTTWASTNRIHEMLATATTTSTTK